MYIRVRRFFEALILWAFKSPWPFDFKTELYYFVDFNRMFPLYNNISPWKRTKENAVGLCPLTLDTLFKCRTFICQVKILILCTGRIIL